MSMGGIELFASEVKSSTTRWYPITTGRFEEPSKIGLSLSIPVQCKTWQPVVLTRDRNIRSLSFSISSCSGNLFRQPSGEHISGHFLRRPASPSKLFPNKSRRTGRIELQPANFTSLAGPKELVLFRAMQQVILL